MRCGMGFLDSSLSFFLPVLIDAFLHCCNFLVRYAVRYMGSHMSISRAFDIFSTTNFCHVFGFSLASWIYFDRIGLDGTVSKNACFLVYPLMYMPPSLTPGYAFPCHDDS